MILIMHVTKQWAKDSTYMDAKLMFCPVAIMNKHLHHNS